jgi:hypothetical protein
MSFSAHAYEVGTHTEMSVAAYDRSVLSDHDFLKTLGISAVGVFDKDRADPRPPKFNDGTARGWIREGSVVEDNNIRPANHFYNPLTGQGIAGFKPSPDWALEDKNDVEGQDFSYKHARQYFYDALTAKNPTDHDNNFGKTFESLGHVIHHLQDMAQPQHVRDDIHCDALFPCLIPGALIGKYNPSLYEKYTDSVRGNLSFADYAPLFLDPNASVFSTPRKLWRTSPEGQSDISQGAGIAEYTNRNFVSAGTNFDKSGLFPSPVFNPANKKEEDIKTLIPGTNLSGIVTFYGNTVQDTFRPSETRANPRASTESIFDADLKKAGNQPVFSLNRFNFNAAHEFLIPRAVAYSAGLIDYFFRGRLGGEDIELTDTGIRLRVKNAIDPQKTPAWQNETLYATNTTGARGTFVVAFEYKDATGQTRYGVSEPVNAKTANEGGGNLAPGQVSSAVYDFSLSVPSGARDVKYRLVFRGRLGQEDDALAVGPVDPASGFIFYPTYVPADGISGLRVIYKQGEQWQLTDQQNKVAGNIDWKGWYRNGRPTKVLSWVGPNSRYFPASYLSSSPNYFGPINNRVFQNGEVFAIAPRAVLGAALTRDSAGREWLLVICRDGTADVVYRRPNVTSNSQTGWDEIGRFAHDSKLLNPANTPWFFNGSGTEAQTIRSGYKAGDPKLRLFRLRISIAEYNAAFSNEGNLDDDANVGAFTGTKTCNENQSAPGFCGADCSGGFTESTLFESQITIQSKWSGSSIIAVDYVEDVPVFATYSVSVDTTNILKILQENSFKAVCSGRSSSGACNVSSTWENKDNRNAETRYNSMEKINMSGFGDIIMESVIGALQIEATKTDSGVNNSALSSTIDKSGGGNFQYATSRLRYLDLRYGLYSLRSETKSSSGQTTNVQVDFFGGPFSGSDYAVFLPRITMLKQVTGFNGELPVHQVDLPGDMAFYDLDNYTLAPGCNNDTSNPGVPRPVFMDPAKIFGGGSWSVDSNNNLFLSESKLDKDMQSAGAFSYLTGASGEDPRSVIPTAPQGAYYESIGVIK